MERNFPSKAAALWEVSRFIRPLARHLHRSTDGRLEGLSAPMRVVLEFLVESGPTTVPIMARAMGVRRQSIQSAVDDLATRRLVRKAINFDHKRSWMIELSPRGERVTKGLKAYRWAEFHRMGLDLSREEIQACARVLTHMSNSALWR